MLILTFDTSLNSCSLTISRNRKVLSETILFQDHGSSEVIIPILQEQVKKAKIQFHDIDLIGISRGPGSYTGVRVGISVAKGLALSLKKPIVGVSSLQILAYEARINTDNNRDIIVINKARGKEIYFQYFSHLGSPKNTPTKLNLMDLMDFLSVNKCTVTGNLISDIKKLIENYQIILYENNSSKFLPSTLISYILNDLVENNTITNYYGCDPIYLNT